MDYLENVLIPSIEAVWPLIIPSISLNVDLSSLIFSTTWELDSIPFRFDSMLVERRLRLDVIFFYFYISVYNNLWFKGSYICYSVNWFVLDSIINSGNVNNVPHLNLLDSKKDRMNWRINTTIGINFLIGLRIVIDHPLPLWLKRLFFFLSAFSYSVYDFLLPIIFFESSE